MQTKRLGRTDVDISIVGVGTAFLGIPEVNDAAQAYADMSQPFAGRVDRELQSKIVDDPDALYIVGQAVDKSLGADQVVEVRVGHG